MILPQLFLEFFKTGLFAVGGGLATLPFVYRISDAYGWFSYSEIADMIAISESTPGPIGVNIATYAGFHSAGILGAILATLGLVTPSIIVILLISKALEKFKRSAAVKAVFSGLRPAATGLIAAAGLSVISLSLHNPGARRIIDSVKLPESALFLLLFAAIWKFKWHPIAYIAIAAAYGVLFSF